MRYINNYNNFRLLLEKIKKDSDYYAAREDLHKPADFLVQRLENLSDKAGKSGGGQTKEEFERKARDMFYDIFDETIRFFPDDRESIRTKLDSLVVVSKKYPRMSASSEDYFLILNLTDKSGENVTSKDDTIMVDKIRHRFSENSSYSFKLSVREDFVNTRSKKFEQLFIKGISDTIDRITAIKIIESFISFYFSVIVPKDPKREKVRELSKKGKTVEQIAKSTKLSKDEVEKLIGRIELQNEYEAEENEPEETDMEYRSAQPDFEDAEAKNVYLWDKMINNFRDAGKQELSKFTLDRNIIIDFDIMVDKFKNLIQGIGYSLDNCNGDYKEAICNKIIKVIQSENLAEFAKIFNPKNIESVYYFVKVCSRLFHKKSDNTDFDLKPLDKTIVDFAINHNFNVGAFLKFNSSLNSLKSQGVDILKRDGLVDLVDMFQKLVIEFFKIAIETDFSDFVMKQVNSAYLAETIITAVQFRKSGSKYKKFFDSYSFVYVCAKIHKGIEVIVVKKEGVINCMDSEIYISQFKRYRDSDSVDHIFRIVSDTLVSNLIGKDKIEIKNLLTGAKKRINANSAVEVEGFYLGDKLDMFNNPLFVKSEADINYR